MFEARGESLATLEVSHINWLRDGAWCYIMLLYRLRNLEKRQ